MDDALPRDVLGQKAQAAQRAHEARAMSPAKALRRAFSRAADVLWDLALVVQDVRQTATDQDGVVEAFSDDAILLLLDGPDGAMGLVCIDRQLTTGVVEVQTIRQVTQIPPEDRPLTQTDAAMLAPLVDEALSRMSDNLGSDALRSDVEGYRFGAMLDDKRAASLLLEAPGYHLFETSIDLALGRRQGRLVLALPQRPAKPAPDAASPRSDGAPGPYAAQLQAVPVDLTAILTKFSVPLSRLNRLTPGDLLPLPAECLDGLVLRVGADDVVAGGRLGQLNGKRAVRILWPETRRDDMAAAPAAAPLAAEVATAPLGEPAMPALDMPMSGEMMADGPQDAAFDMMAMEADAPAFEMGAPMDLPEIDALAPDSEEAPAEDTTGEEDLLDIGDFDFSAATMDLPD